MSVFMSSLELSLVKTLTLNLLFKTKFHYFGLIQFKISTANEKSAAAVLCVIVIY